MTTDATLNRLNELSGLVGQAGTRFISDARLDGAPVVVVEAFRTQQRQNALYAQGRTKPGQIVTWTLNSLHTQRRAFDVAFFVNGRVTFDVPRTWWEYLGAIAPRYGLRWGPTIGLSGDLGHYEL
jgi:peptidoglycan L-alanyl-D-glutamate endopeptidase CwlK